MPRAERASIPPLRVVRVPGKGRGVVAGRGFSRHETVTSAHVVVMSAREWEVVSETVLGSYCFEWDDAKGSKAVALGPGSLFNHSYEPNVAADKSLRGRVMRFAALRDIHEGEELTINYNGDPDSGDPVGFNVMEQ